MDQHVEARPGKTWEWLLAVADPVRLHILTSLLSTAEATASDLASGLASPQTLRRHLEALVSTGVVAETPGRSDGETPGRPAARFRLEPNVRAIVSNFGSPSLSGYEAAAESS
jgi:predicted ArsR family transcriptional regulator